MKRMLDQKTIDTLQELLSKIQVDGDNVNIAKLFVRDGVYVSDIGGFFADGIHLDSLTQLKDNAEESSPLLPLSGANAGKVLAVNSAGTGVDAVDKETIPDEIVEIQMTEDDYDADNDVYIKEIQQVDEQHIYRLSPLESPVHEDAAQTFTNPKFHLLASGFSAGSIDSFSPGFLTIIADCKIQLINGTVFQVWSEY